MKHLIQKISILLLLFSACSKYNSNTDIQYIYDFELHVINQNTNEEMGEVFVELYNNSGELISEDSTDGNGIILYPDLEIGLYSVNININSYVSVSDQFVVSPEKDMQDTILVEIDAIEHNSPIIITGYCSDPRGSDGAAAGTSSSYSSTGVTVEHLGGYEYVQLMATIDIDFSQTPYSLVVCKNGSVGENGWAEGDKTTYKFNLTEGSAAAGTFFYVGGMSKVISGYGNCGKSTDISSSNWIRTIDYKTDDGDGLGNARGGLLPNISSTDENSNADGIAVFEGIDITKNSVPIDAVFYGTDIGSTYDETNNWGYQVPDNDLYSRFNSDNNTDQPYFGQGSNTYLFGQVASDVGQFSKLGGVVSSDVWYVTRTLTIAELSYCPGESTLYDIEEDNGVIQFIE